MSLVALDVAVLPPDAVARRAIDVSAGLPSHESQGLVLGPEHFPHITLLQQFVRVDDVPAFMACVGETLQQFQPLGLRVTGGGTGGRTVWLAIERAPALVALHERLLEVTEGLEDTAGDVMAFFGGDARDRDVNWVTRYRAESSLARFLPHITLGHAARPPLVEPFDFEASTVAVCHLGRFCSCRRVLRAWELSARSRTPSRT
jgi:2'-5' RNA ligase